MNGGAAFDNHPETPRRLQELARHQMITRLYMDILADMAVCDIEGWDKMEFIRQLQACLNRFTPGNRRSACISKGGGKESEVIGSESED